MNPYQVYLTKSPKSNRISDRQFQIQLLLQRNVTLRNERHLKIRPPRPNATVSRQKRTLPTYTRNGVRKMSYMVVTLKKYEYKLIDEKALWGEGAASVDWGLGLW